MLALIQIVLMLLDVVKWIMIAMIVMSWLIAFNVINTRNQFVDSVWRVLRGLTEPLLRPIRRFMPDFGGVDISPIVLFLIIYAIEIIIRTEIAPRLLGVA